MNNALVEFIKALTTMKFYGEADDHWDKFSDSFDRIGTSQALIDLENVGHACSDAGLFYTFGFHTNSF
jgi:hypothetical protein